MSIKNHVQGFTLLEVLLSGFILFLAISSLTGVYQGALISTEKSEHAISINSTAHAVRRLITDQFRDGLEFGQLEGQGTHGEMQYEWVAELTYEGMPSQIIIQEGGSGSKRRYRMWEISFTVKKINLEKTYRFSEISW